MVKSELEAGERGESNTNDLEVIDRKSSSNTEPNRLNDKN